MAKYLPVAVRTDKLWYRRLVRIQIPLIFKERHAWRVKVLVFSSDGKHLVSGSRDNSIRLWDTEIGVGRTVLREHTGEVKALAFSTDGTTLISGSIDGTILSSDWERIIKKKDK